MTYIDWIAIAAIAVVIGGAVAYIIKAKKSGRKCIGCPNSCACAAKSQESGCGGSCQNCTCACAEQKESKK